MYLPLALFSQEGSILLFDDSEVKTGDKAITTQHRHNNYLFENLDCYGFIFDNKGKVWYRDYCPNDYIDISEFGSYAIQEDTVNIFSSNLSTQESIHRIAIKEIEHKKLVQDTFMMKALNTDGNEEGTIFSVFYNHCPRWPWSKTKSIDLRKPIDWTTLPDKIHVQKIWVSNLKNQPPNNGIWYNIDEKWEIKNKKIEVTFFDASLRIVRKKNELILFKWDRFNQEFMAFDRLLHVLR